MTPRQPPERTVRTPPTLGDIIPDADACRNRAGTYQPRPPSQPAVPPTYSQYAPGPHLRLGVPTVFTVSMPNLEVTPLFPSANPSTYRPVYSGPPRTAARSYGTYWGLGPKHRLLVYLMVLLGLLVLAH